jgi:putative oxidoreductase
MTTTTQVIEHPILEETKGKNITLWVLQAAAAFMFIQAGYMKLSGNPQMVGLFDAIGIGQWFRYLTGSIEVSSAVLLLIPSLAGVGALLLLPTMIGAVLTHAFIIGGNPAPAIFLLVVSGIIAYGRRNRTRRLLSR